MNKTGFTLVEILVTLFIVTFIGIATSQFARNVIIYNTAGQDSLNAQLEGRKVLKVMVAELRSASVSALGSYPIDTSGTSTLIFFSDLNGDGLSERIRYYTDPVNRTLKKGVVIPSGNPVTYNLGGETVSTLVTSIANGTSTDMFNYYDSNYAGTTTPLTFPPDTSRVRLVKITVLIDEDPNRLPNAINITSEVGFRNLKDNL